VKKGRMPATDKLNPVNHHTVAQPRGVEDADQERLQPDTKSCHVALGHKWPLRGVPSKKTGYWTSPTKREQRP
jgi:hypothetical protein